MSEPAIEEITDAAFESTVLAADDPIVVVFRADWCGPCKAVESVVRELGRSDRGAERVVQIDVDRNPNAPSYYGVTTIPAFLRFVEGEVVDRVSGAARKPRLRELFGP